MNNNPNSDTSFSLERVMRNDKNDIILDNIGQQYDFVKSMCDGEVLVFKHHTGDKQLIFDKFGKLLNAESIYLRIEQKKRFKDYTCLLCDNHLVYFKINNYCYFVFSVSLSPYQCNSYKYMEILDADDYFNSNFNECVYPLDDTGMRKTVIDALYELGYGYNAITHEIFPKASSIVAGKYYIYENAFFKASDDIESFDYRQPIVIPYEFYVAMPSNTSSDIRIVDVYEISSLGLGYYSCMGIRECTEKEQRLVDDLYNRHKVSKANVKDRIRQATAALDKAMKMLNDIK